MLCNILTEWKYGRWCKPAGYIHGLAISYDPESQSSTPTSIIPMSITPIVEEQEELDDDEKEINSS